MMVAAERLSPVHKASLVDPSLHSPALMELLDINLSRNFLEYVVDNVVETVDYALGRPSSSSRGRSLSRHSEHAKFTAFVTDVIHKAEVKVPALLVTLVYIDRAKPHLQIALEQWACERVFLGALILANKYLNDSTLKNIHWALCTGVFGKRDIGRIEREFLDVLDFELGVHEADILSHHGVIMSLSHPRHRVKSRSAARPSRARARSPRSPPRSRWSSDSSDGMDLDSESSSCDSASSPRTPDAHVHDPAAAYGPAPAKHACDAHAAPHIVLAPTPSHPHVARAHAGAVYSLHESPRAHTRSPRHARTSSVSSALQLLHSFPLPHFPARTSLMPPATHAGHMPPPSAPKPPAYAVARSVTGCRPIEASHLAAPTASYAPRVYV
ncbi:hypothetical protein AcV5_006580 [Taiwanofungus camphoratus]|nr:hypothetical protein AcV5_006580 [Antrodia cinnamomea]